MRYRPCVPIVVRALVVATALATALASAERPLAAQVVVVDEGSFSLLVDGTRIGREDFSIRAPRSGSGNYIAQANILLGDTRHTIVLTVDSVGSPLSFQSETRNLDGIVSRVTGDRQRGIWSARTLRQTSESAREFRLPLDTFVAEPGVVHHLWFVLLHGEGRPVTLLAPSGPDHVAVVLDEQAPDRVALGLREFVARRWLVRLAQGGAPLWEIWTDASGRLLRALHAQSLLEALRVDPPAETRGDT